MPVSFARHPGAPIPGWLAAFPLSLLAFLLTACSSLPPRGDPAVSVFMPDTAQTRLGRALAGSNPQDGRSGLAALPVPHEAFAARLALVKAAEKSLDLQYYIWHPDISGVMLLDELRRAAERGVRVRLLLDDNGIAGLDADLAWLDSLPGIEVRLFNPYPHRRFKLLGYATDFQRVNHRMHNKALVADALFSIVGGRNIGDAYFGVDPQVEFADLDVLAAGPIAVEVSRSFDTYWNSEQVWPIASLGGAPAADGASRWAQRTGRLAQDPLAIAYAQALLQSPVAAAVASAEAGRPALEWVPMRLVVDPPQKATGTVPDDQYLASHLAEAMGLARVGLDIVSPYFVPGDTGAEALGRQAAQGLNVRILTNSLAATDVAAVHAGYARHRRALLAAGVHLHELKRQPLASRPSGAVTWASSAASLHGKVFAVDRTRAFVGSFNLDPRSYRLNTELGLVIDSPRLAGALSDAMDRNLPLAAYELRQGQAGGIEWVERTPQGEVVVHTTEPAASFWRRVVVKLLSWLPIEGLL